MNRQIVRFAVGLLVAVVSIVVSVRGALAVPTLDTATQGNWVDAGYGSSGYILPNYAGATTDLASLPSWITSYNYSGAKLNHVWSASTTDIRAPQNPLNPGGNRVAATAYSNSSFNINVDLNQATDFQLGVYGLDWDGGNGRAITVTVDGEPLLINNFADGVWGLWDLSLPAGTFSIQVVNSGSPNATISAITFDEILAVPEPSAWAIWSLIGGGMFALACWQRQRVTA